MDSPESARTPVRSGKVGSDTIRHKSVVRAVTAVLAVLLPILPDAAI